MDRYLGSLLTKLLVFSHNIKQGNSPQDVGLIQMASQVIHSSKSREPLLSTGFCILAPLGGGLMSAQDRERIERFCRKLERAGCVSEDSVDIDALTEGADRGLLMAVVRNAEHVLRPHFPPVIS